MATLQAKAMRANGEGRGSTKTGRDVTWSMVIAGIDPDPAGATRISNWAKGYWDAIHPHSAGGAYINFMMEEGSERVQATYQNNYNRLVQVKKTYDPTNFLRVNQNIKP